MAVGLDPLVSTLIAEAERATSSLREAR